MMSVMLSEGKIVSSPPVEPTPPPEGFSLYPSLFSVTCRQGQIFAGQACVLHNLPTRQIFTVVRFPPCAHGCDKEMTQWG